LHLQGNEYRLAPVAPDGFQASLVLGRPHPAPP
jgi:hypothetical protein